MGHQNETKEIDQDIAVKMFKNLKALKILNEFINLFLIQTHFFMTFSTVANFGNHLYAVEVFARVEFYHIGFHQPDIGHDLKNALLSDGLVANS